jgi:oligopeptide transport system permease protein
MTRLATLRYLAQRSILIVAAALAVSSIVFIGVRLLPGNAFLTDRISPSQVAELLHHYHLDRPLLEQYLIWLGGLVRGDLGESFVYRGQPIAALLAPRIQTSLILGGAALLIIVGLGIPLGLVAAMREGSRLDFAISTISVIGYSTPTFVTATLLVLFATKALYSWTGGSFYYQIGWGQPGQIPIPAFALALPYVGIIVRQMRAGALEVLRQDYVRTAWAKGLRERQIILRHVVRNALIPVISILGPVATVILTGLLVIENIFGIPGLGREFMNSILSRDYNMTVAAFTVYALLIGAVNLLVDMVFPMLDPRIRIGVGRL